MSTHLSVCLSVCLPVRSTVCLSISVCPSVHLSVCLSIHLYAHLSVCMSICLSICLSIHPPVCPSLSVRPSTCLYVCPSVRTPICLSVCPSVCPYACLSVRPSACHCQPCMMFQPVRQPVPSDTSPRLTAKFSPRKFIPGPTPPPTLGVNSKEQSKALLKSMFDASAPDMSTFRVLYNLEVRYCVMFVSRQFNISVGGNIWTLIWQSISCKFHGNVTDLC